MYDCQMVKKLLHILVVKVTTFKSTPLFLFVVVVYETFQVFDIT